MADTELFDLTYSQADIDTKDAAIQAQVTANTSSVARIEKSETYVDKTGIDVNTILLQGKYDVDTNLPDSLTSSQLDVFDYDATTEKIQRLSNNSNDSTYYRSSALGDGSDWTTWAMSAVKATNADTIKFTPQTVHPAHLEGQEFYCDIEKTLAIQTDIAGLHLHTPTDSPIRVINRTGAIIPALSAIRNGGIDATSSKIKVALAQANLPTTAFVIGINPVAIPIDGESWILANGIIHNVDTSALAVGGTLFLSDTVAGGLQQTIPDIASALGTVQVSSATVGEIFVKIDNLITYPQVTGVLRGQNAPLYNVTTASQDIINFTDKVDIILTADALLGKFTIPLGGHYQITFTSIPEFISSTSTRTIYFELYNETESEIVGAYPRNIPRDATEEGMSFTAPIINATAGHVYKMRVRASLSVAVTFNSMALMLTSHYLG